MIVHCYGVQLPIVDADSSFCRKVYLDLLAFHVNRDHYSSFLWDNVHRTHPLAIGYGVNNFCIQPFKIFFFHNLSYLQVESSLGLPDMS